MVDLPQPEGPTKTMNSSSLICKLKSVTEYLSLPLFQYNYTGQYFNDYGPSFASYVVGIITITIVYLIFQKNIIAGMSNGAVK